MCATDGFVRIGVGVGTPARILALIREGIIHVACFSAESRTNLGSGALKLDRLDSVVLDMSAVNEKQQGIFDIRETHKDMLDLLNEPVIKSGLGDKIKLLVY
jgi:protein CMS1